jgi:hypothetical protein
MFLLNNKPISLDTAFTTEDGTQYPANWIRLASPAERAAIGITEVDDAPRYDDRFYWASGQPKDLDLLKIWLVNQVKVTAGTLLAPTDWKVIRAAETNTTVDGGVLVDRRAIRAASNANETAINACTTVDELAVLQLNWPE